MDQYVTRLPEKGARSVDCFANVYFGVVIRSVVCKLIDELVEAFLHQIFSKSKLTVQLLFHSSL